jgi:hypothetical protein
MLELVTDDGDVINPPVLAILEVTELTPRNLTLHLLIDRSRCIVLCLTAPCVRFRPYPMQWLGTVKRPANAGNLSGDGKTHGGQG